MTVDIRQGDALAELREMPTGYYHCVVTSPPYWGLRDYGTGSWEGGDPECDHTPRHAKKRPELTGGGCAVWSDRDVSAAYRDVCGKCGARRIDQQIGLEPTPEEWCARLIEVFREVRRVLRTDGVCFVNIGDSYAGNGPGAPGKDLTGGGCASWSSRQCKTGRSTVTGDLKPKDLVGQPWMLAFALRADGWWLRSEIIWCLSGGTRVYARTQKGEMPTTIKDLVRLDPATVQLWNGEKWTQVLGWSETPRPDRTYEIELRSGQRIGCTAGHLWPTQRGKVRADEILVGDIIKTCRLPEPETPRQPNMLPDFTTGWFVGLYLAEGSRGKDDRVIQIASHAEETLRFQQLRLIAKDYDGTFAVHPTGSPFAATANIYSPTLSGVIDTYLIGNGAAEKHLTNRCWRRSDTFLRALLEGYLEADGHFDAQNNRWRVGFTANDAWAEDLRTICARLGVCLRLRRCEHTFAGRAYPGWRGEIRFERSGHQNCRDDGEVVAIRESRARKFWDIGVADEPHLFALASGVLTHNSKPNAMPESVRDRPTKAHEQVFLLTKASRYFWDAEAVRETAEYGRREWSSVSGNLSSLVEMKADGLQRVRDGYNGKGTGATVSGSDPSAGRNLRSVWTIATDPLPSIEVDGEKLDHFASYPIELARRCILAGTSAKGCCPECGAPWARTVETSYENPGSRTTNGPRSIENRGTISAGFAVRLERRSETTGWRPTCSHMSDNVSDIIPCRVLDPFGGSGRTALAAEELSRDCTLIELNPASVTMARAQIERAKARRMIGDAERVPALPGQLGFDL